MILPTTFTVTDDHIKLLNRLYVEWYDDAYDGAPAVDIKRPYGNSDVMGDVAEILGWWEPDEDRDDEMPDDIEDKCMAIHKEMHIVLQILAQNPTTFSTGVWTNVSKFAPYAREYRKKEDVQTP